MKLDLNDLQPKESKIVLSEKPGKTYTLKKFSLAAQIWLRDTYGPDKIKDIFENQRLGEIAEIAFYLMKDKSEFKTPIEFMECIVTQQDRINLIEALLETIGISQPIIDQLSKEYDEKNVESPIT
jgi:hypothetical protein